LGPVAFSAAAIRALIATLLAAPSPGRGGDHRRKSGVRAAIPRAAAANTFPPAGGRWPVYQFFENIEREKRLQIEITFCSIKKQTIRTGDRL
jgi:hypothetical protein